MHIHNTCEILYFCEGNADFSVEGNVYHLHKGDLVITRQSESHYLVILSPAPYERIVVNFPLAVIDSFDPEGKIRAMFCNRQLGQYNHFSSAMFPEKMWRYYLDKICTATHAETKRIYLLALLDELAADFGTLQSAPETTTPDKTAEIIRYIDRHLFDTITLEQICARFFISKAHLNRIFKSVTGTTVGNYISSKRLIAARELLRQGERPTRIYEKIGFANYVSFYKAYKKAFGTSPKEDMKTSAG